MSVKLFILDDVHAIITIVMIKQIIKTMQNLYFEILTILRNNLLFISRFIIEYNGFYVPVRPIRTDSFNFISCRYGLAKYKLNL